MYPDAAASGTHRQELLHFILEPYSEGEALQPGVQSSNVAHLTEMNELVRTYVTVYACLPIMYNYASSYTLVGSRTSQFMKNATGEKGAGTKPFSCVLLLSCEVLQPTILQCYQLTICTYVCIHNYLPHCSTHVLHLPLSILYSSLTEHM